MGYIEIQGKIRLDQFWPQGKSDADTTKILVSLGKTNPFMYYPQSSVKPVNTEVFYRGKVKPAGGKSISPVKYAGTARQYITLRLEGIDAPELHYRFYDPSTIAKYKGNAAFKKANIDYRQHFSEIATTALKQLLKKYADNDGTVPCVFISDNIDKPGDLCDVYGRFIGYILIDDRKININHWLVEKGLVFPSFYDSALPLEIKRITSLYKKALSKPVPMHKNYSARILAFDPSLKFRPKGPVDPSKDRGKLILPKLYRRQCCHYILSRAGASTLTYTSYLDSLNKKDPSRDKVILIADFPAYLGSGGKSKFKKVLHLTDLIKNNTLTRDPSSFVLIEGTSTLIDPATGKPITKF